MALIQFKRASSEFLKTYTDILAAGEPLFEKDTGRLKIGDGVNQYKDLPYVDERNEQVEVKVDNKSIEMDADVLKLVGFDEASKGSFLTKGEDGLEWVAVDFNNYYTKDEVDAKLAEIKTFSYSVVEQLPENPSEENEFIIYLVDNNGSMDEYIAVKDGEFYRWEMIGSVSSDVDLSGYYTSSKVDELLSEKASAETVESLEERVEALENDSTVEDHINNVDIHVTAEEKESWNNKSDFSGSYNDLTDKPEIPSIEGLAKQEDVDTALEAKADKSELTDINERLETLENKADEDTKYTGDGITVEISEDNVISAILPDVSDFMTSTEIENQFVNNDELSAALGEINETLEDKAEQSDLDDLAGRVEELESKEDKDTTYTAGDNVKIDGDDNKISVDLSEYAKKTELSTYKVVEELPSAEEAEKNTVYLLKNGDEDTYTQYVLVNGEFKALGSAQIDAYTKDEADDKFAELEGNATQAWVEEQGYLTEHQDVSNLATKEEVEAVEAKIPSEEKQAEWNAKLDETALEGLVDEETLQAAIDGIEIPEVPENVSAFNNDAGYLVASDLDDYAKTDDLPTEEEKTLWNSVEEKITSTDAEEIVNTALEDYSTTEEMNSAIEDALDGYATEQFVTDEINKITHFTYKVVDEIPTAEDADDQVIYLVAKEDGEDGNVYNEYLLIDGNVELIGDTKADLSDYVTSDDLTSAIEEVESKIPTTVAELTDADDYVTVESLTNDEGTGLIDEINSALEDITNEEETGRLDEVEKKLEELEGASHDFTEVTLEDGQSHEDALATVENPVEGDYAVVITPIADGKNERTAYVYCDDAWKALDGNYSADNVFFGKDLIYTENIGVLKVDSTGSGTIAAEGKSLTQVISAILAEEKNPEVTQPTAKLTSSNIGSKEVGEKVSITYTVTTTDGSYQYDGNAGMTFDNYSITFNDETLTTKTGTFSEVQVIDSMSLQMTGSVDASGASMPHTNIGNDYADGKIEDTTISLSNSTKLTGYRKCFYGYKTSGKLLDVDNLTSGDIRGLNWNTTGSTSFTARDMTGMQQIFVAIPHSTGIKKVAIANSKTDAPQTVEGPVTVAVEGANGYTAIDYDVFYCYNAAPDSGTNNYKFTASK